jgi:hypothetical protein
MQRPIVITLGDPAGIGPEIIVKAFRDAPELTSGCCVVGDIATLRRAAQVVGRWFGADAGGRGGHACRRRWTVRRVVFRYGSWRLATGNW